MFGFLLTNSISVHYVVLIIVNLRLIPYHSRWVIVAVQWLFFESMKARSNISGQLIWLQNTEEFRIWRDQRQEAFRNFKTQAKIIRNITEEFLFISPHGVHLGWRGGGGLHLIPTSSDFAPSHGYVWITQGLLGGGWGRESAGKEFMVTMCPSSLVVSGLGSKDTGAVCGLLWSQSLRHWPLAHSCLPGNLWRPGCSLIPERLQTLWRLWEDRVWSSTTPCSYFCSWDPELGWLSLPENEMFSVFWCPQNLSKAHAGCG